MEDVQEVLAGIIREISVMTSVPEAELLPDGSFADNRIDSLSFVTLLLFVKRRWQLDYLAGTLAAADVASPAALAKRIVADRA